MNRSARVLGGRARRWLGCNASGAHGRSSDQAGGDDQGVEPAWSVIAANSPLPSCVTLV